MIDANEQQTTEGVFHGDRETRKQLKKAKKLLDDGRFSEALPMLDDILESSQDYFDSTEENQVARQRPEIRSAAIDRPAVGRGAQGL